MIYHDNYVDIPLSGSKIVSGTYTVSDFAISSGQDTHNHIYVGFCSVVDPSKGALGFSVGRHKTSQVATWVKKQVSSGQMARPIVGSYNFAFIGQLKYIFTDGPFEDRQIPCVFDDVVLTQTSQSTSNIWNFGGKHCTSTGGNGVICPGVVEYGFRIEMLVKWIRTYYFSMAINNFEVPIKITPPSLS
ncbi:hypothetical protein [Trinickia sp.]|uniref:hypothetical protein n=1 Tax=Trinickia sp. TaxID=2571163 RepID=UPI003F806B55